MATYRADVGIGREMVRDRYRQLALQYSPAIVGCLLVGLWLAPREGGASGFFLGMAVAWTLSAFVGGRYFAARYASHCRRYREPITVTLEPDAMRSESEHGSSLIRASSVARVRPGAESFVLEFTSGLYTALPRRHLSADEVAILDSWARTRRTRST
jgi:hypothetical protein